MTRIDVYKYSKDREIIHNHKWQSSYKYVRIGSCFYRLHDLVEINILNESNENDKDFTVCGKISIFKKIKIRLELVRKLLRKTK